VPKALVIAHSPHNFSQFRYAVLLGGFAHWRELPTIIADYGQWTNSLYAVLTRGSYLLKHRDSFQSLVRDHDLSFFRERDADVEVLSDRSELFNFRRELPAGIYDQNRLQGDVPEFYSQPFTVLDLNDRYFRRLLAMAKAYGVKVYWFTMPTPQRVLAARARVNYERDLRNYLRQFERSGELRMLRGEFVVYDDTLFRDWLHLNLKGAVKLACEMRGLRATILADLPAAAPQLAGVRDADDPQVVLNQYCGSP
jgi:hypothetical protein